MTTRQYTATAHAPGFASIPAARADCHWDKAGSGVWLLVVPGGYAWLGPEGDIVQRLDGEPCESEAEAYALLDEIEEACQRKQAELLNN